MGTSIARFTPEILVLSHDDHDHIGGWDGFALTGLTSLKELWVPYEWGLAAAVIVNLEFGNEPNRQDLNIGNIDVRRNVATEVNPGGEREEAGVDFDKALARAGEIAQDEKAIAELTSALKSARKGYEQRFDWRGNPRDVARRALSRTHTLLAKLRAAKDNNVAVRYFSVDHHDANSRTTPWKDSGFPTVLTIANAVEVTISKQFAQGQLGKTRALDLAPLQYLSIQNRRALSTVLWGGMPRSPKVLVWSDSAGDWACEPSKDFTTLINCVQVASAPHHGSDNRAHNPAWHALQPFLRTPTEIVMVAAGGITQQKVHRCYLAIPKSQRECTRCRHGHPTAALSHQVVVNVYSTRPPRLTTAGCPF
jgi:hypothetical protein